MYKLTLRKTRLPWALFWVLCICHEFYGFNNKKDPSSIDICILSQGECCWVKKIFILEKHNIIYPRLWISRFIKFVCEYEFIYIFLLSTIRIISPTFLVKSNFVYNFCELLCQAERCCNLRLCWLFFHHLFFET